MLNASAARMREQLDLARAEQQTAERKADASAQALSEVQTALSFPVDTVNRSLLFTAFLEKEGKINRSQIIRFLMDHARKMEHTWDNMQVLVANISLASGPQPEPKTPARRKSPDLFRTPQAGGPSETKTGPDASPDDMVSTPDFVSPLTVGNFPPVLADILSPAKTPLPEVAGPSGAHSPSPTVERSIILSFVLTFFIG